MGRGILLWLLGVPIPIIILLALIWHWAVDGIRAKTAHGTAVRPYSGAWQPGQNKVALQLRLIGLTALELAREADRIVFTIVMLAER